MFISVVRKSSQWSSWYYVNQSSGRSLYQRLRCVCRTHTTEAATLVRPRIRTQQRHCPLYTILSSRTCPSVASSNYRRSLKLQWIKPQASKSTANRHNEVLSDGSSHHHHHLRRYCNCRDLGALRVCRRCALSGFTRHQTFNAINNNHR